MQDDRDTELYVYWDNLVRYVIPFSGHVRPQLICTLLHSLASEYGLHPVYKKEFHQVFEEHHEQPEFAPLLQRMHVVDANGESQMDEDQWEAASTYTSAASRSLPHSSCLRVRTC